MSVEGLALLGLPGGMCSLRSAHAGYARLCLQPTAMRGLYASMAGPGVTSGSNYKGKGSGAEDSLALWESLYQHKHG